MNSSAETGTRYYSGGEVRELVNEISEAAEAAIERAAAEAAKAATLAGLEREAELVRARETAFREAQRWEGEYRGARSGGIRNMVITGVVCFLSGLAIGAGGVLLFGGR
ncbi:hypothetical protein FACS1894130_11250 [Spirochaetia bacterium]|nr:hypothetical protein FACS1894130_11250 [Spirochaetia bacterium]